MTCKATHKQRSEGKYFTECERKFLVSYKKLQNLPQPWVLLQGYFPDPKEDVSVRCIPARERGYYRRKSVSFTGCRQKLSKDIDFDQALEGIFKAPNLVVKERYLVRDERGRAWLIDHDLMGGHWRAETELEPSLISEEIVLPEWCIKEVTNREEGYTRSWGTPLSYEERVAFVADATVRGSQAAYEPSEDANFMWTI